MKKEILQKGIILPLIIGIVLAIVFSVFLLNSNLFGVVSDGTVVAYHDNSNANGDIVKVDSIKYCKANDVLGNFTFGSEELLVRYNADYANTISCVSFVDGAEIGSGVSYFTINQDDAKALKSAKRIGYEGTFGKSEYTYSTTKTYASLFAAKNDLTQIDKGLVFLYQAQSGNGLTSDYTALIFEEVA